VWKTFLDGRPKDAADWGNPDATGEKHRRSGDTAHIGASAVPGSRLNSLRSTCDIAYPFHDKVIVVTNCGRICLGRKKINFSTVFATRRSASKKFTTTSGWSVLWIMIWNTSIWRLASWNRRTIPSAQKCYLCSWYRRRRRMRPSLLGPIGPYAKSAIGCGTESSYMAPKCMSCRNWE
jgi:hypothetical protein